MANRGTLSSYSLVQLSEGTENKMFVECESEYIEPFLLGTESQRNGTLRSINMPGSSKINSSNDNSKFTVIRPGTIYGPEKSRSNEKFSLDFSDNGSELTANK